MTTITKNPEMEERITNNTKFSFSVKKSTDTENRESYRDHIIKIGQLKDPIHGMRSKSELSPKVRRRIAGYFLHKEGKEALVAFEDDGELIQYYLPFSKLKKSGIMHEDQPFEMDELEVEVDGEIYKRYEFRPLALKKDRHTISSNEFSDDIKSKYEYILNNAPNVKD